MTAVLAIAVGALFGIGTYLLLQRALTRIVIGLGLIGHGTNLLLVMVGGPAGQPPLTGPDPGDLSRYADPLPQALALTAIVIAFGVTAFLLALAWRSFAITGDDEVEDDVEDRRIARLSDAAAHDAHRVIDEGVR
ncbi:MAG TPA: Na(+)/H(+) antiporter subunit C [Euzebya sp.]|nr:Na(+)/H(+) antiporter subunit C [Euzebya sp.]